MIDFKPRTPFYIKDVIVISRGGTTSENMYKINEVIDDICKGIVITDEETLKGRWYSINTFDNLYSETFNSYTMIIDFIDATERI